MKGRGEGEIRGRAGWDGAKFTFFCGSHVIADQIRSRILTPTDIGGSEQTGSLEPEGNS